MLLNETKNQRNKMLVNITLQCMKICSQFEIIDGLRFWKYFRAQKRRNQLVEHVSKKYTKYRRQSETKFASN